MLPEELRTYLPEKRIPMHVHSVLPEPALPPEAALLPRTCPAEPLRTGRVQSAGLTESSEIGEPMPTQLSGYEQQKLGSKIITPQADA
jgi:hypothetical protein